MGTDTNPRALVNSRLKKAKFPIFEWPFSRTLSSAKKARPTPEDAQFCQVSHGTFYDQFSKKQQKNASQQVKV